MIARRRKPVIPKKLVMIVDDEKPIRESFQFALEHEGFAVVTAGDGTEALTLLEQHIPVAILLDIKMRPMDGWSFLEALAELPQATIPIYVITALTGIDERLHASKEQGKIRDFIIKPFIFSEILLHELHKL